MQMNAAQMTAFRIGENELVFHPVTVLNVQKGASDDTDVDPAERVDRAYWGKRSAAGLSRTVCAISQFVESPRITWNRNHVVLGSKGYNYFGFNQ